MEELKTVTVGILHPRAWWNVVLENLPLATTWSFLLLHSYTVSQRGVTSIYKQKYVQHFHQVRT